MLANDVLALSTLLTDTQAAAQGLTSVPASSAASSSADAGAITSPAQIGALVPAVPAAPAKPKAKAKAIWADDDSALTQPYVEDPSDLRKRPEYEVRYKQRVGVYDMYSGMDFEKDPSSMRCEEMVIVIQMPQTRSAADVVCDVKETVLDVRSEQYKLILPLPRKVYTNKGAAKWDDRAKSLSVTLVVNYEDYVTKIL
eukprot:RCo030079